MKRSDFCSTPTAMKRQGRIVPLLAAGALLAGLASMGQAAADTPKDQVGGHPASSILLAQAPSPAAASGSSASAPARERNPDQKFVEEAATGGMAEVEAGKLAQTKASAASVKTFAQQMVADHTKANDQLKQIALGKGIMLPTGPDRSHSRDLEKAGKLQGAEFDREYMKMMVADHKKTVSLFEKEAKSGKDAELKSFAATMLPDLQKHLQMAQSTEAEVKKSGNR